jgi:(R,R)-butanediol dehydrogenase/meso-butanediol dehydrogenase/diacetyl reductase
MPTETMRAMVYEGPERLAVREVPVPAPGPDEALIRTRYIGICGSDLHLWAGDIGGVDPPVVIGHEIMGEVVAAPLDSAGGRFAAGDRVVVEPMLTCGHCRPCREGYEHVCHSLKIMGVHADGGAAPLMRVPVRRLHRVPDALPSEIAALAEPVAVAVHMVKRAEIALGDSVLVIGGGPIGYLVAAVARAGGAGRVAISEVSQARLDFCRRAGFDVIDARASDTAEAMRTMTGGEGADVVVEVAGHPSASPVMIDAARGWGRVLIGGVHGTKPPVDLRAISVKELRLIGARVYTSREFATAIALLASGALDVAKLVTSVVPLDEAVPRGFKPLRESPAEMKVLIALPA